MKTEERAGFPAAAHCMTCHQAVKKSSPAIQRLAALPKDAKPFSARLYKVADYVIFSHSRHVTAKIECAACHGPVLEREVLKIERPTTMKACVECHRLSHATLVCTACHEVGF